VILVKKKWYCKKKRCYKNSLSSLLSSLLTRSNIPPPFDHTRYAYCDAYLFPLPSARTSACTIVPDPKPQKESKLQNARNFEGTSSQNIKTCEAHHCLTPGDGRRHGRTCGDCEYAKQRKEFCWLKKGRNRRDQMGTVVRNDSGVRCNFSTPSQNWILQITSKIACKSTLLVVVGSLLSATTLLKFAILHGSRNVCVFLPCSPLGAARLGTSSRLG